MFKVVAAAHNWSPTAPRGAGEHWGGSGRSHAVLCKGRKCTSAWAGVTEGRRRSVQHCWAAARQADIRSCCFPAGQLVEPCTPRLQLGPMLPAGMQPSPPVRLHPSHPCCTLRDWEMFCLAVMLQCPPGAAVLGEAWRAKQARFRSRLLRWVIILDGTDFAKLHSSDELW